MVLDLEKEDDYVRLTYGNVEVCFGTYVVCASVDPDGSAWVGGARSCLRSSVRWLARWLGV